MPKKLKDQLVENYLSWLKTGISTKDLDNGIIEITSPFMDKDNDYLQVYVIPKNSNHFKLTDDGYIVSELFMSGCDIHSSKKRKSIFETILNGYGVQYSPKTDELFVEATINNFPQKKHMLLQAMLTVNDMFMTSRSQVQSIFLEDVGNYLFDNDIRFTENISFTGKSGYNHSFNFVIPRSKKAPERIVQAINNPTKDNTKGILFSWSDIRESRKGSKMYTFLNDTKQPIDNEVLVAFINYDIIPVVWSQKENYLPELIA